jgi:hypothetical protein
MAKKVYRDWCDFILIKRMDLPSNLPPSTAPHHLPPKEPPKKTSFLGGTFNIIKHLVGLGVLTSSAAMFFLSIYNRKLSKQDDEIRQLFGQTSSILLVIAHPEDEALFFAPAFEAMVMAGAKAHILSISSGGSLVQGRSNEKAFNQEFQSKGVIHTVLHDAKLQSDMATTWDSDLISDYIVEYCGL